MEDPSPTLLLTRPQAQSEAFLLACEKRIGRRLPVVISPLLRIEALGNQPDLTAYGSIIITSWNGVERLKDSLSGRKVFTVGEKTAQRAREHGANAKALGENISAFLENSDQIEATALLCRGVHSRGEILKSLLERDIKAEEVILYDQVREPLGSAALQLITGPTRIAAPIFSPRTAKLLSAYSITAPMTALAISKATRDAWDGPEEVRVATHPDAESMLDLVQALF